MSEEFDNRYPGARSTRPSPRHWPPDVKSVAMKGLDLLGIDTKGQIYWDGKLIKYGKRLQLSAVQAVFAFIVGLAAVIGGFGSGIKNGFEFGCNQGWWKQGCSAAQAPDASVQSKN